MWECVYGREEVRLRVEEVKREFVYVCVLPGSECAWYVCECAVVFVIEKVRVSVGEREKVDLSECMRKSFNGKFLRV